MGDRAIRDSRRMKQRAIGRWVAALALLLAPVQAGAWGFYAHGVTADIAYANVSPQTRAKITELLRQEAMLGTPECRIRTIAEASVWPDCVRRTFWRWGYTAAWHYRTTPICEAYNPRANCSGGNCVTAQIERSHRILADEDHHQPGDEEGKKHVDRRDQDQVGPFGKRLAHALALGSMPAISMPSSFSSVSSGVRSPVMRPSHITTMRSESARISSSSTETSSTALPWSRRRTIC